jgi:hypothetical protein
MTSADRLKLDVSRYRVRTLPFLARATTALGFDHELPA